MNYYFWQNSKAGGDAMLYGSWPHSLGISMLTGALISRDVGVIDILMNDRSQGRLTDNVLMTGQGRIFSGRLVELLKRCGVDNLETFPCRIRNEVTGEVHEDYFAANIVGRIACVDHGASACDYIDDESKKILIWDHLTLNESQIHDASCFVLAEMPVQIVVHKRIKQAVEAAGITGVEFVPQGDHAFVPTEADLNF